MNHRIHRSQLGRRTAQLETLELRQLLAVDFPAPEATPWPANLVYQSQLTAELSASEPLEMVIGLKAGQLASFSLETTATDLSATATLIGPTGNEVPARIVAEGPSRFEASTTAVDTTGDYTLRLDSQLNQAVDVQAVAYVNQVFESEHQGANNDVVEQAMSLDPFFTSISAGLTDEIVNIKGNLNDDEVRRVDEDFESGQLSDSWSTASSFAAGRIFVDQRIDGFSLVMDTTATDPDGIVVPLDVVIDYESDTGRVIATASDTPFTTLEIMSNSGIFTGTQPDIISEGQFNVYRPDKMFVMDISGLSEVDFGPSAAKGLTPEFLLSDLAFNGSLLGGGGIRILPAWTLDDDAPEVRAGLVINEAVWKVPLSGLSFPLLKFDYQTGDGNLDVPLPEAFGGRAAGTGVSVSVDGQSWHTITSLDSCGHKTCSISRSVGSLIGNLELNAQRDLWIKFQNTTFGAELRIDNLSVESLQASDWYEFHLEDGASAYIGVDVTSRAGHRSLNVYDAGGALITAMSLIANGRLEIASHGGGNQYFLELVGAGDYDLTISRSETQPLTHFRDGPAALDANGLGRFLVAANNDHDEIVDLSYEADFEDLSGRRLNLRASVPDIAFSSSDLPPRVAIEDDVGVGEVSADIQGDYDIDIWIDHDAAYYILEAQFEDAEADVRDGWLYVDRSETLINEFELRLPYVIDRRTLDKSDFLWNGPEISSIEVEFGHFLRFQLSERIDPGEYELTILPESIQDPTGRSIETTTHLVDLVPPTIESMSISEGDKLPTGESMFVIRFDSELNNIFPHGSISLSGPDGRQQFSRNDFQFTRGSQFVALALGNLPEGEYDLRFARWQFTDLNQNRTIDPGFSVGFEVLEPAPLDAERSFDLDGSGVVDGHDLVLLQEAGRWPMAPFAFDLNSDGKVTVADVSVLVQSGLNSRFGDTNLDGRFDSSDLVQIFNSGSFGRRAAWISGDFTGDGFFDSDDLVLAFQHGTYSNLDPVAVAAAMDDDFDA